MIPIPAAATSPRAIACIIHGFALIPIPAAATYDLDAGFITYSFALIPIPAAATCLLIVLVDLLSFALIPIPAAATFNDFGQLRESRAIGQDADHIIYIEKVDDDTKRLIKCIKNRTGERFWELQMDFLGQYYKFREQHE